MSVCINLAPFYFHQGTNFYAYKYLGCNLEKKDNKYHYTFRTWAPNADEVGLVSDFSGWDTPIMMKKVTDNGVYEVCYESNVSLDKYPYKFLIRNGGREFLKGDPYARFSRGGADGASLIFCESKHKWTDKKWLNFRHKQQSAEGDYYLSCPLNIYEVHLASFMRHDGDNSVLSYREAADVLVPYLKYMGYTHIELMPVQEHPYDGSWGYQVCGFYAPTSRFGDPDDFRYFVNKMHQNGIGVIMDWVPAHFPKDAWGLYEFDGVPLYEYQGKDRMESQTWGTRFFDLGREEVQSFLISNALYFLREFHIDGLRADAVASMLYLDYDRTPGEWIPNTSGGRENLEAVAFFRKLNTAVFSEFSDVLMIAEESGSFNGITKPCYDGGLGFNLKWNMGWANDFYDYLLTDPLFRKYKHKALNFPIMYAFNENYVLPISHDEVVHGKLSLINKMYGEYENKFKQMRAALLMMMSYPGKKMMFMGTEFAQFREWDYENSLEWFMLDYPNHRAMRDYVCSLNRFYLEHSEMWEIDFDPRGFEWILADDADHNSIAYIRKNKKGKELIFVINYSGSEEKYSLRVDKGRYAKCIFETGLDNNITKETKIVNKNGEYFMDITLPPFSGGVYKIYKSNYNFKA